MRKSQALALSLLAAGLLFSPGARALTIEWANVGSDFATGTNWVGGTAPANSTTTDVAAFGSQGAAPVNPVLASARSVGGVSFLAGAYSYNFSGSILTIGATGISNSAANVETFSNTLRPSASETWSAASGASTVFNGSVDINGNNNTARTLTISGAGTTTINGVVQNSFAGSTGNLTFNGTGTLILANTNTYNGNTIISSGNVTASKDGALGAGNVSLTGGTVVLTLQSGTTNNYIADNRTFSIATGAMVTLNFVGTDTVGALVINGVPQAAGVYNATTNPGIFTGTGSITNLAVVPEPATYILMGLGVLICAQQFRRKRS